MNLTELLDRTAHRWPDQRAIVEGEVVLSYRGLVQRVAELTTQLETLGLAPGCRVGLCYPNGIDYVALTFALWRVQAVVVPIPIESTPEEVSSLSEAMQLEGMLHEKPRGTEGPLSPGFCFEKLVPTSPPDNHGLNIAFIRFTSGTTQARKGVVLCHETVRDRVAAANRALGIGPDDIVMWSLPMAHHFLITIVLYLSEGATIILERAVVALPFLEAVNRCRATVLYAAPFHYGLLARDGSGVKLSTVRLAVSTTCALPEEVAADFFQRFDLPLVQGLGIIELGLVSLNTDDPRHRWNSVGRPRSDFRVRVQAPDEHGCGEIAVCGPGMLDAYAAPWMPRDVVAPDGWFTTGDVGWVDADGFLFLAGRTSAVINLAGRKVFPEEVEAVLNRHPAVRESRVFGRRHLHLGEVVEAELVLTSAGADLDSIRTFCQSHLASYKIPMRFHSVAALPRTPVTGKIRRRGAVMAPR